MRCLLSLLFAAAATAQAIHHVGAGQTHAQIQSAIAAASPGDVVAIHAGTYLPFVLDKGLTLRPEPAGAVVAVEPAGGPSPQDTRCTVPAGQHVRCAGLVFRSNVVQHRVVVDAGLASFDACSMVATTADGLAVTDAAVTLTHCTVDGRSALVAVRSHVVAQDCRFTALQLSSTTGNGVDVTDGSFHACRSICRGSFGVTSGLHGVRLGGSATAWLVDSTLEGGSVYALFSGSGGNGLRNQSSVPARLHRCTISGGTAIPSGTAPPVSGAVQYGPLLGVTASATPATGGTWSLDFASEANLPVFVVAAFGLQPPAALPALEQQQWGFLAPSGLSAGFAIADQAGHAVFAFGVPAAVALRDVGVWFTGVSGSVLPLQASPPVGGVIR